MSGDDKLSPDGRWEVSWRIEKDFSAYFESDTRWEITLRNAATKEVYETFYYSEFGNSEGWTYSGVKSMEFSPDSASAIATYEDGRVETIPLPPSGKDEARAFYRNLAQSGSNQFLRGQAVKALAEGWKDDPETLPFVKALVQSDTDGFVRNQALDALVEGWKDDPETLLILKALAQSERDKYVRTAAVRRLARNWKDHPDTLPILKALAQADENSSIRKDAREELEQGWKRSRTVQSWLKKLPR